MTEHIGLIATVSTTYNEPFHVARKFASLDHISGGRAGWNIVTSAQDARGAATSTGTTHPDHADRYQRAAEFLDVALQALGQLGGRRAASSTPTPASSPTPTGCTRSTTRARSSGSAGR